MALKRPLVMILVLVLGGAFWKVWEVTSVQKANVLALTTTRTLEERVASLESRVYSLEKNSGLISTGTKKMSESFVVLTGGSVSSSEWSKIQGTDFSLDASLYGKTVEVSWQGWLEGGVGGVRLYDATNHRAVDFSEFVSSSDIKRSFYTKVMSIWRGQNQYYIEGKTLGGVITLSAPRLKIVVK